MTYNMQLNCPVQMSWLLLPQSVIKNVKHLQYFCAALELELQALLQAINSLKFGEEVEAKPLPRSKSASQTWAWAFSQPNDPLRERMWAFILDNYLSLPHMTHPRCYSTSKGPLQLMWRPGNTQTTGELWWINLTVRKLREDEDW